MPPRPNVADAALLGCSTASDNSRLLGIVLVLIIKPVDKPPLKKPDTDNGRRPFFLGLPHRVIECRSVAGPIKCEPKRRVFRKYPDAKPVPTMVSAAMC
jgi:hypothetical protein